METELRLLEEFFYMFYGEVLFLVVAVLFVISMFLAITEVVKVIDEA